MMLAMVSVILWSRLKFFVTFFFTHMSLSLCCFCADMMVSVNYQEITILNYFGQYDIFMFMSLV